MKVVVDAGILIAHESRPDAAVGLLDEYTALSDAPPRIPATVVAQVWRSGWGRQAPLVTLLARADIDDLDAERARQVGRLLAEAGTDDITDAHVVVVADPGDLIITSDPVDIAHLARAAGKRVAIAAI